MSRGRWRMTEIKNWSWGVGVIIFCSKILVLTFTTIKRKKVLRDVCFLLEVSLHAPSPLKNLEETHTLYPSNSTSGNVSKSNNERCTEGFIVMLFKIRKSWTKFHVKGTAVQSLKPRESACDRNCKKKKKKEYKTPHCMIFIWFLEMHVHV